MLGRKKKQPPKSNGQKIQILFWCLERAKFKLGHGNLARNKKKKKAPKASNNLRFRATIVPR
jgi:hypothetical protein